MRALHFIEFHPFINFPAGKKSQNELETEKTKIFDELSALKKQQLDNETQLKELTTKFNKMSTERNALDKLHKMKIEKISG